MNKYLNIIGKTIASALILLFLFPLSCTKEYKVEVSVEDWDYNEANETIYVRLRAKNTGEIDVKNISCELNIKPIYNPYATPVASKDVNFGGGKLSPGSSAYEDVVFTHVSLSNLYQYKIEVKDVGAEPAAGLGCDNPVF